jgi:hypothetical protein
MLNNIRELGLDISINNIHTVCMEIQILHMVSTAHFSLLFSVAINSTECMDLKYGRSITMPSSIL